MKQVTTCQSRITLQIQRQHTTSMVCHAAGGFSHLCLCQQLSDMQISSTALSSRSACQWFFHKIQTLHKGDTRGDALCSSLSSLWKFSFALNKPAAQQPATVRAANRQGTAGSPLLNQGWSSALICTFLQVSLLLCSFPPSPSPWPRLPEEPGKLAQHTFAVKNIPEYSHSNWKNSYIPQPCLPSCTLPILTSLPYFSTCWNRKRFSVCTCPRARNHRPRMSHTDLWLW